MSEKIDRIRKLLDDVEKDLVAAAPDGALNGPLEIELASVVRDVVDYLQPLLTPYQAAFYWYLFRQSIAANGLSHVRVSTRGLQKGVVRSARSEKVSQTQVKELLAGLEAVGAIRKEAEPNREGTLYRVLVPELIESCREYKEQLTASKLPPADETQADFYNVRENRRRVYERDDYKCHYCGKQLTLMTATLDHVTPVAAGGDNSFENLITSCLHCNSRKNRRPVGDFLAEDGPK